MSDLTSEKAPCLANPVGNGTSALAQHSPAGDHYPECLALKTRADEDPRWNTESPDIAKPLCKGTYWRFWPSMHWDITIPNDHIFDAAAIAGETKSCGLSVYRMVPWQAFPTWIQCDMRETTGYLKFRVVGATEVPTIAEAFNQGTCHAFEYVNCYKEQGHW